MTIPHDQNHMTIPCDTGHMTESHDILHHMMLYKHIQLYDASIVISRTTSKMMDVYGINTCVCYLCYCFHTFPCCFFVCSMCVLSLVFTSSTAQAAFKGNSVPKQVPLLLFFVGSYVVTMCSGGPHQQLNDHATLNNYSDS